VSPKKCGHFAGKAVISAREMVGKLHAAVDARDDPNLLIVARTDACATDSMLRSNAGSAMRKRVRTFFLLKRSRRSRIFNACRHCSTSLNSLT